MVHLVPLAQVELCAGDAAVSSALRDCGFSGKEFDVAWLELFSRFSIEAMGLNALAMLKFISHTKLGLHRRFKHVK